MTFKLHHIDWFESVHLCMLSLTLLSPPQHLSWFYPIFFLIARVLDRHDFPVHSYRSLLYLYLFLATHVCMETNISLETTVEDYEYGLICSSTSNVDCRKWGSGWSTRCHARIHVITYNSLLLQRSLKLISQQCEGNNRTSPTILTPSYKYPRKKHTADRIRLLSGRQAWSMESCF